MSVLKSRRTLSKFEFEHTFATFYQFSVERMASVAKRRHRWICWKMEVKLNKIFNELMEINEGYFESATKREEIDEIIKTAIEDLRDLEKPMMVFWNIEQYEIRRMVAWASMLNAEIDILSSMRSTVAPAEKVQVLDWRTILNVKFLSNIFELHRIIHGKVVRVPSKYDDTYSSLLIDLIDEALYSLAKANRKMPTTKKEYDTRKKHISNAISCLRKMQRPLVFFFNVMGYSERSLNEISEKISEELKMLYALNKSDKTRFGKLE